ncbi:APC family permease [Dokdonella sp.]|uniref:APC family permease n=1 Tax=Dokdonella sp. TaxID=2291710 RepID=UPI003C4C7735
MPASRNHDEESLPRQLSVIGFWLLIVNGMIGAGIFGLPGELAKLAGEGSVWVFILCALMIAPIMLCFAQLSSYFHGTGGPILYASSAFGPMAGFQVGWLYYISRVLSFAANLNLLITSLGYLWPDAMGGSMRIALAFVICSMMTLLNVIGARGAVRTLGLLTVVKIVPLIVLVGIGLVSFDVGQLFPHVRNAVQITDLGAAVFLVIYAYVGFEGGVVPAGEARNPKRDIPRALIAALAVCALLYTLIQAVSLTTLPALAESPRPLVDVAQAQIGEAGALLMLLGIIASVGGNLLGAMFSTPRLTYRMAIDGHLPPILGRVHPRFRTPAPSIILYGAASFAFAVTGGFVWLAGLSVLARLVLYFVCIIGMPRLRRKHGGGPDAMHLPGSLVWMGISLLVCVALLLQVKLDSVLVTIGCMVAGSFLYYYTRTLRRRSIGEDDRPEG